MILLDTCVLLWLVSDQTKISPVARREISKPQTVFISAISAYEIGQKAARKALTLPMPIDEWIEEVMSRKSIQQLPVTSVIAARATLLPPIHQDPFDRILVASAIEHRMALITPDPLIRSYPNLQTLW